VGGKLGEQRRRGPSVPCKNGKELWRQKPVKKPWSSRRKNDARGGDEGMGGGHLWDTSQEIEEPLLNYAELSTPELS